MQPTRDKIRNYLLRTVEEDCLHDDDDIFELGFVNSLFAVQLILFIEKEFQVELSDEEMDLGKIRTIRHIANLITDKQKIAS